MSDGAGARSLEPTGHEKGKFLSRKRIPPHERLIVALDVPTNEDAEGVVRTLGDAVHFYKLGLEILLGGRYVDLVGWLIRENKKVMVDLKLFDVPQTVASAVRQLRHLGVSFATVHGNDAMLRAAVAEKNGIGILAVTALTSLDQRDLDDLGFKVDVRDLVLSRARHALEVGCDGVISSGLEAPALKSDLGERVIIVSPGIRPVKNTDDQKRTVDIEQAFYNGADYIVVGRPIRAAKDQRKAAEDIQRRIAAVFRS